jgi:hypothetical protein
METTTKDTFTFIELPKGTSLGGTERINGIITMGITSDANAIHEATHGFQIFSGGAIKEEQRLNVEVPAYKRQYSFDSGSVTGIQSDWGSVGNRSDINKYRVTGIYNPNDSVNPYPYMKGLQPSDMRKVMEILKKKQ